MDLRSSTRSRRSKSRTPFAMTEHEEENTEENYSAVVYSENIRTSSSIVKSSNGKSSYERLSEEQSIRGSSTKPAVSSRRSQRFSKIYKTSDYSSEDGENEVSSTRSISENERNRILEDARKAADTSTGVTALGLYRKAKQYWEEYPKTDWTYSPFSKDRVEIAPGVVAMPNMSRRHISSYDRYTSTSEAFNEASQSNFLRKRHVTETTTYLGVVKRNILRIFVSIFSIVHLFLRPVSYAHHFVHSACVLLARAIYSGTSAIMLLDTWLLRSNRNYGKAAALTALCVIPFLLIGGWWLSLTTKDGILSSMTGPFSADNVVQESTITPEELKYHEHSSHSKPDQTGFVLTEKQLEEILQHVKANLNTDGQVNYQEISRNILQTETIQNIINEYKATQEISNQQDDMKEVIENQRKSIDELTNELNKLKTEMIDLRNSQADANKENIRVHSESSQKMDYFLYQLNRCCKKATNLEAHMLKTFVAALNNPNFLKNQEGLANWLNSLFVAKTELENKISEVKATMNSTFDDLAQNNNKFLMDQVATKLNFEFNRIYAENGVTDDTTVDISEQTVRRIVRETLKIYDADKTGLVDYAMEPMGGQVITTRCTESYHAGTAVVSVFGLPLWYPVASPRTVITPGISPGKCWAFQNFPGILVIKLMGPIKIEAFSYEHVSKLLVPDGRIDSAPKDIEVYGLQDENDRNGVRLGSYRYDYNGESLQFFASANTDLVLQYVELRVLSNHGNPNYTCLYRFRVHGKKVS